MPSTEDEASDNNRVGFGVATEPGEGIVPNPPDTEESTPMLARFERAVGLLGADGGGSSYGDGGDALDRRNDPGLAASLLEQLQEQVARLGVLSSNESLREVATSSIPLLTLEHYLAVALTQIPSGPVAAAPTGSSFHHASRQARLFRACDLWTSFLRRLERIEFLSSAEIQQVQELEDVLSSYLQKDTARDDSGLNKAPDCALPMPPPVNRDVKIARFRARQELVNKQRQLHSLRARRTRLGVADDEEMDGYDGGELARSLAVAALDVAKIDAFEELASAIRELPMLAMMIHHSQKQEARDSDSRHPRGTHSAASATSRNQSASTSGLRVTQITKDAFGQLQVKREEIRGGVFRPGWNQPTVSLDELAEREVREALERQKRHQAAEAQAALGPQRYEQLQRNGQEDDADLVDASADVDRKWDDWKDENPRGSGNKRGDIGDRNF
jgi:hypothetical protein